MPTSKFVVSALPIFIFLNFLAFNFAKADNSTANLLAIGQGVSSPTSTSTINYTSGYTSENPLGVIYQNGIRLTGEYDQNGTKGYGGELGYGKGTWGVAAGYYKHDCTNCQGRGAGAIGITVGDFGLGIRFAENLYAVGLLFNPQGTHRFGIVGELNNSGGTGNTVNAFGVGYSYVAGQISFTVDASKRQFENTTSPSNNYYIVSPGLQLRADILQVSINDHIFIDGNSPTTSASGTTTTQSNPEHDFWFGVGIGTGKDWHVAVYGDYVNEIAGAVSFYF
jgi:hypothetical protein